MALLITLRRVTIAHVAGGEIEHCHHKGIFVGHCFSTFGEHLLHYRDITLCSMAVLTQHSMEKQQGPDMIVYLAVVELHVTHKLKVVQDSGICLRLATVARRLPAAVAMTHDTRQRLVHLLHIVGRKQVLDLHGEVLFRHLHTLGLQDDTTVEYRILQRETGALRLLPDLGDVELTALEDLSLEHHPVVDLESIGRGLEVEHLAVLSHQGYEVVHLIGSCPQRLAPLAAAHRETKAHGAVPLTADKG